MSLPAEFDDRVFEKLLDTSMFPSTVVVLADPRTNGFGCAKGYSGDELIGIACFPTEQDARDLSATLHNPSQSLIHQPVVSMLVPTVVSFDEACKIAREREEPLKAIHLVDGQGKILATHTLEPV